MPPNAGFVPCDRRRRRARLLTVASATDCPLRAAVPAGSQLQNVPTRDRSYVSSAPSWSRRLAASCCGKSLQFAICRVCSDEEARDGHQSGAEERRAPVPLNGGDNQKDPGQHHHEPLRPLHRHRPHRRIPRRPATTPAQPSRQPATQPGAARRRGDPGRNDTPGRAYSRRKPDEGKSRNEALRALKRQIAKTVHRHQLADAHR
jgi:hypothetical protein